MKAIIFALLVALSESALATSENAMYPYMKLFLSPEPWAIATLCGVFLWFVLTNVFQSESVRALGVMVGGTTILFCFTLVMVLFMPPIEFRGCC